MDSLISYQILTGAISAVGLMRLQSERMRSLNLRELCLYPKLPGKERSTEEVTEISLFNMCQRIFQKEHYIFQAKCLQKSYECLAACLVVEVSVFNQFRQVKRKEIESMTKIEIKARKLEEELERLDKLLYNAEKEDNSTYAAALKMRVDSIKGWFDAHEEYLNRG